MNFRFNIRTKVFLLLAGLTTAVLLIVLLAVNNLSSTEIRNDIVTDFDRLGIIFSDQQFRKHNQLLEGASLMSIDASLIDALSSGNSDEIYFKVLELIDFTQSDIMVITDIEGTVLSWFGNTDKHGINIDHFSGIHDLVTESSDPFAPIDWAPLWLIDATLYQVASVPIYENDLLLATLTLGFRLGDFEAKELADVTDLEIAFFSGPIASMYGASDSVYSTSDYASLIREHKTEKDSLIQNLVIGEPFETAIRGEQHLAFISPLGVGENSFYIASAPFSKEFEALNTIQRNILLIALISILIILPVAVIIGRVVSTPINRLSAAMQQVSDGELDVSIKATTNDEVGLLTNAFNDMIVGLRERFALSRYVGEHTLRMIEEEDAPENLKLGGSFEKFAILFTDIRGSTATIEKSDPEKFVRKLNETLGCQAETILEHGGVIDKFVGDSVIALFTGEDALDRALKASVQMQKRFRSKPSLNTFFDGVGIGVNYGSMILGNMGAAERMDYTVIGPEVNLCARLCSAAKSGEILIRKSLISDSKIGQSYTYTDTESLSLKGFSQQIDIVKIIYD